MGLGPSSDFLNATVGTGVAPTTSLGIWPGSRSVENPVDGLLVIGGYDSARVSGEFTQFQSFQNCFTCAEIVELNYTSSTGSTSLFSNSSEVLQVSFEPFERSLPVPQDIFENFMDASGGYFDSGQGLIAYPRGNPPEGNLSIVLQNGYSSTIPASELFISPRTYGNNGVYSISNDSILVSHVKNTSDPRYVPSWGIPFLTMNYLVVDYQTGHFRLAPAYRQEFGVSSGSLIQPLCSGTGPTSAPSPALPTTSGIAGGNGNSTVSTAIPQPKGHHTNTGAIAGGVAGGIVGLAIILVLGFLLVRQRKRARRAEQQVADAEVTQHKGLAAQKDVSGAGHESTYTATSPTEVSSQELEGKQYRNVNEWLGQHNTHDEVSNAVPLINLYLESSGALLTLSFLCRRPWVLTSASLSKCLESIKTNRVENVVALLATVTKIVL